MIKTPVYSEPHRAGWEIYDANLAYLCSVKTKIKAEQIVSALNGQQLNNKAEELLNAAMGSEGDMVHCFEINSYTGEIPQDNEAKRIELIRLALNAQKPPGTSYCKIHDTYPADDEPCWQCVNKTERDAQKPKCKGGDVISMIQSVSEGHTISLTEAEQRLSDCQKPCETCGGSEEIPNGYDEGGYDNEDPSAYRPAEMKPCPFCPPATHPGSKKTIQHHNEISEKSWKPATQMEELIKELQILASNLKVTNRGVGTSICIRAIACIEELQKLADEGSLHKAALVKFEHLAGEEAQSYQTRIEELEKENKWLKKQPRCPCGEELEGLGYDIKTKDEVWQCKKCDAQIILEQAKTALGIEETNA